MIIGIPREIKSDEYRVAMLPVGVSMLTKDGHKVLMERGAGLGSGFDDQQYIEAEAEMVDTAEEVFDRSDMVVKVKEPQPQEIQSFKKGQTVFTYFHFASSRDLTVGCLQAGIDAVAYETLTDKAGRLPLLRPMSEVAGKMSIQEAAKHIERPMGGLGVLLGGVVGVAPANVLILGGGVVGSSAAGIAAGFGARVVVMDIDLDRLMYLEDVMPDNVTTVYSDPHAVRQYAEQADVVIGGVLIPGARAPKLLSREHLKDMKDGAVIVDVCIDQGGCIETSRPTTHHDPTYIVEGVVHYCVANMPGAVSRTSTMAMCNATLRYVRKLAALGVDKFAALDAGHAAAVNMRAGKITSPAVAEAFPDLASN